jgi:hypothetical protein
MLKKTEWVGDGGLEGMETGWRVVDVVGGMEGWRVVDVVGVVGVIDVGDGCWRVGRWVLRVQWM